MHIKHFLNCFRHPEIQSFASLEEGFFLRMLEKRIILIELLKSFTSLNFKSFALE